jgi:hypothetical protein
MHIIVRSRNEIPILERLLTTHLPALQMNHLILEINYGFAYQSHPEVAGKSGLTQADCRALSAIAAQHGVELIPMFNCLGHQSWAQTTFELLTTHPEFDETPELPPHNPDIYCRSWCPLHPEVNPFIFALCDELIEAFDAKAFHVGLDEVFILGKCPRCKEVPTAELFAKAVNDYHAHFVGKRSQTLMIWGDRLLDSATTPYGTWEASDNGTAPAIDRIPKDIVICDWHYEQTPYPSLAYFQEKGFRVLPAAWNRPAHVENLLREALQNRTEKMLGYLATTWENLTVLVEGLEKPLSEAKDPTERDLTTAVRRGAYLAWNGIAPPATG